MGEYVWRRCGVGDYLTGHDLCMNVMMGWDGMASDEMPWTSWPGGKGSCSIDRNER